MKLKLLTSLAVSFKLCAVATSEKRIVGGEEAVPGQYSFAISLQAPQQSLLPWSSGLSHYCGGSLISRDVVLTAAHCGPAQSSHRAVIDRHDLDDKNEGQSIKLSSAISHPAYDSGTTNNDIMLIFLQEPADQDIDIVKLNSDASTPANGVSATVMGWGTTSQGGSTSDVLMEVEKKTMSNSQCASSSGNVGGRFTSYAGSISNGMLCAADRGEDSCQGDSGGPLVINRGDRYEQIGVVSWGFGCALPDFPGVYARTSTYYEWIQEQVCSRSSYPSDDFGCDLPEPVANTEVEDVESESAPNQNMPEPVSNTGVEDVESESAPNQNTGCNDMDWVDKWGDDCRWYETNDQPGCPAYGHYGGDMGLAKDECCHCRGATGGTPGVAPAPSPAQPPAESGAPSFICSVFSFLC